MNQNRYEQQKALLCFTASVLSADQFDRSKAYLEQLSDHDFDQLLAEAAHFAPQDSSLKSFLNLQKEVITKNGETVTNSALEYIESEFMSEGDNAALLRQIDESHPSDTIRLDRQSDSKIISLWESNTSAKIGDNRFFIPSDLFFAETVPLKDCKIIVDEQSTGPDGKLIEFRVVIFSGYEEKLRYAGDDDINIVGAVVANLSGHEVITPIRVVRGVDGIVFGNLGYRHMTAGLREYMIKNLSLETFSKMFFGYLETWYGIQIALLHPTVREVFKNPKVVPVAEGKGTPAHRKHKVKYQKVHVLNADELELSMCGGDRPYSQHTLVWYVIGHWRRLADGRKTFVKPYWKGALRDIKQNLEDRDREIVFGGEKTCAN